MESGDLAQVTQYCWSIDSWLVFGSSLYLVAAGFQVRV